MPIDLEPGVAAAPALVPPAAARTRVRPLRVCHVISADLWAGAEVQVATTAAYLVTQPHVALEAVLFNDGPLAESLRDLGVPTAVLDERRHGALAMVRALARHFRDHRIDLVHTHRHSDTVIGAAAATLAGVRRMVRTVHGLREPLSGWQRLKFGAYETLERLSGRARADAVIAVSNYVAEDLKRQGYDPARIVRIHNGIHLDRVRAGRARQAIRRSLGLGAASLVIGTAGRLTAVKAQERLLRAAQIISRQLPGAAVLIVGDGPRRRALESTAASLGIADACVFTGSRGDAYDLVAAMDVFTLPSISEGTPMALLEAMALGVPVVATAVGGVPEIVEHRVHGLLVESGDDQALANACLELASNPQLACALASRARVRVEAFSAERSGAALLQAYSRVANAPVRPGVLRALGPWGGAVLDLADRVSIRGSERAERRRQRRHRVRNGLEMAAALRSARRLLVVCHGNIIRSAFAAHLLMRELPVDAGVTIRSAGMEAVAGRAADPRAIAAAAARGIDLRSHTACRADARLMKESDIVLVMDVPQLLTARERLPEAHGKIFLFATLAHDTGLEVADPVLGDPAMFERCFDHIARAVSPVVRVLTARSVGS